MMDQLDQIKAIALDLDGTLVGSNHHVSDINKFAVKKAAKYGMNIILASGRPFAGIRNIAKEIELAKFSGFVVGANGACVVDMKTGDKVGYQNIPKNLYLELFEFIHSLDGITLLTYDDESMLIEENHPNAHAIAKELLIPMHLVDNLFHYLEQPVNKFILTGEATNLAEAIRLLKEKFKGRLECVYGGGLFIEIMPLGVSKAEGLKLLMYRLNLTAKNLMCIGDSANDLQMFDYAGFSVAMDNACDEIKKRASMITDSCEKNGVASAIEYLFNQIA